MKLTGIVTTTLALQILVSFPLGLPIINTLVFLPFRKHEIIFLGMMWSEIGII